MGDNAEAKSGRKRKKEAERTMDENDKQKKETKGKGKEKDDLTADVRSVDYYHGLITRVDAEAILKKEGDFVLRKTERQPGVIVLALTVKTEKAVKHFMISQDPTGGYYVDEHREKTVGELINWHKSTKTPLSSVSNAKLKRGIPKPAWLINHDAIVLVKKLGEGAFGEVFLAEFTSEKGVENVAVKTMRVEATREARNSFLKEARMMRKYNHKHVVKMLGVAVHEHPLMIIMEVCDGGSVLSYVKKNAKTIKLDTKLRFAMEAADGLGYLETQKCIHRDIAARNCLLSSTHLVKISDFGMSENNTIVHDDTLDKVPVKWLAPETLQDKIYSLKSDVWAYGIMVWEIYANGAEPYPGLTRLQTRAKIVLTNYRMSLADEAPAEVKKVCAGCWEKEPTARPSMSDIFKQLKELWDSQKREE